MKEEASKNPGKHESDPDPDTNDRVKPMLAVALTSARFVLPKIFALITGYTPKAVQRKIDSGVWVEGREFVKAPDGHRLIDTEGYQKWVLRGKNS